MRHGGPDWVVLEREVEVLAARVRLIAHRAECDPALVLESLNETFGSVAEPRLQVVPPPAEEAAG